MSQKRMFSRLPRVRKRGIGILQGYRLLFHKRGQDGSAKCDAFYTGRDDDLVFGVLYEMTERAAGLLDVFEGLGNGYEHRMVSVLQGQERVSAFMYGATDIDPGLKPFNWHKEHVLNGACENHFPRAYIAKIQAVVSIPDPDRRRSSMERKLYKATADVEIDPWRR